MASYVYGWGFMAVPRNWTSKQAAVALRWPRQWVQLWLGMTSTSAAPAHSMSIAMGSLMSNLLSLLSVLELKSFVRRISSLQCQDMSGLFGAGLGMFWATASVNQSKKDGFTAAWVATFLVGFQGVRDHLFLSM